MSGALRRSAISFLTAQVVCCSVSLGQLRLLDHASSLIREIFVQSASALVIGGPTTAPVRDDQWPAGAVEVANLPSRIGMFEGPILDGSQRFDYVGDAAAFQVALDAFSRVRAPRLELVVHPGPLTNSIMRARIDWELTLCNTAQWLDHSDPRMITLVNDPGFTSLRPVPRIDVYIGGGTIDWSAVKLPANISVVDERADAAGITGPAVRGEVFDMSTSKPMAGATIQVVRSLGAWQFEVIAETKCNSDGRFELKGFAPGNAGVTIFADGFAPRWMGYSDFQPNTLKQYSVYLTQTAELSGTVIDTSGKPVAGAIVRSGGILGRDGQPYTLQSESVQTITDQHGSFTMKGLPRGYVSLLVLDQTNSQLDRRAIFSVPGDGVLIRVTQTGSIRVRLLGQANPNSSYPVYFQTISKDATLFSAVRSLKVNSPLEIDRVPPGEYMVSTDARILDRADGATGVKVVVKPNEMTDVEIVKP